MTHNLSLKSSHGTLEEDCSKFLVKSLLLSLLGSMHVAYLYHLLSLFLFFWNISLYLLLSSLHVTSALARKTNKSLEYK